MSGEEGRVKEGGDGPAVRSALIRKVQAGLIYLKSYGTTSDTNQGMAFGLI